MGTQNSLLCEFARLLALTAHALGCLGSINLDFFAGIIFISPNPPIRTLFKLCDPFEQYSHGNCVFYNFSTEPITSYVERASVYANMSESHAFYINLLV